MKRVEVDERAEFVVNKSYGLAFKLITILLFFDVMYRSFFLQEAAWDLLGIILIGSFAATLYQLKYKIWGARLITRITLITTFIAILLSFIIVQWVLR